MDAASFHQVINAEPYDATSRLVYADVLEEQGELSAATIQRWIARMLTGTQQYDLVMTRQGVLESASLTANTLRIQERNYWKRATSELFEKNPDVAFIIVSRKPKTESGLTAERRSKQSSTGAFCSPVMYYRSNWKPWGGAKNKQFPRVVPRRSSGPLRKWR
jgi:uncharacterized protein (TIGR02996 family)